MTLFYLLFLHVKRFVETGVTNDIISVYCTIAEKAYEEDPKDIPEKIDYLEKYMREAISQMGSCSIAANTVREFLVKRLSSDYGEYQAHSNETAKPTTDTDE